MACTLDDGGNLFSLLSDEVVFDDANDLYIVLN
jgi:hypothetical protein